MKVWKYEITHALNRVTPIDMPMDSRPLFGDIQGEGFYLWAEVRDADSQKVKRNVIVAFTGHEFNKGAMDYLNTFQDGNGLVYHVYADMIGMLHCKTPSK